MYDSCISDAARLSVAFRLHSFCAHRTTTASAADAARGGAALWRAGDAAGAVGVKTGASVGDDECLFECADLALLAFALLRQNVHHIRRRALGAIELRHDLHRGVDVFEEFLVGWAQVVEAPFAVRRPGEAMLGALAVAGETNTAIAAILWQAVALGVAEIDRHRTVGELAERGVHQVAQFVVRVDVVIAGVDIAVVLHSERAPAGLGEVAQSAGNVEPLAECHIKQLHIGFTDVAFDPLIEDLNQEVAVGRGGYGKLRHARVFPGGRRFGQIGRRGKVEAELGGGGVDFALHDRDEL